MLQIYGKKAGSYADISTFTPIQKQSLKALSGIADLSDMGIHVYESEKRDDNRFVYTMQDGTEVTANGFYKPGTNEIWIDLNAGNSGEGVMLFTAGHEISHYIRNWNPTKWQQMADIVTDTYNKRGADSTAMLQRQMDKIVRRDPTIEGKALQDLAYEEMVSDALSEMLADGSVVEILAKIKQQDKTLWGKIKEAIENLLKNWGIIRKEYEGRDSTEEAKFLRGADKAVEQLKQLYAEGIAEANKESKSLKTSHIQNTKLDESAFFSIRDEFPAEIDAWDGSGDKTFVLGWTSDALKSIGVKA